MAEPSAWAMATVEELHRSRQIDAYSMRGAAVALDAAREYGNAERDADVERARAIIAECARAQGRREGLDEAAFVVMGQRQVYLVSREQIVAAIRKLNNAPSDTSDRGRG